MGDMVCSICNRTGIYWQNLTGLTPWTFCPHCLCMNCQVPEPQEEEEPEEENDQTEENANG